MGQLSLSGLGKRSGSAVAVRQGALRLRDLHKDTTGPGQGREGGGDFTKHSCVSMVVSTTCQTIHNSLVGWSQVIGGQHHQRHGKGAWSRAGVIRGSGQVDRAVTCSRGTVI